MTIDWKALFGEHVELIMRQDDVDMSEAKFRAVFEGTRGLVARRAGRVRYARKRQRTRA